MTIPRSILSTRAVFLLAGLCMASWAPLVPFAQARLGIEAGTLGLLLLCLGAGSLVAMPITGMLTARFGCRIVIIAASMALLVAMPFLALTTTPAGLAVTLAVFGGAIGTIDVAMNVQAVEVEKNAARPLMSGFHGMFSLGGILGAGGATFALGHGLAPFQTMLLFIAIALALLVLSLSGLLPAAERDNDAPLFVLPKGIVVVIGLMCFVVFLAEGAVLDWGALMLIEAHDVAKVDAGIGYMMFAIAMTFGRLTGDRIVTALGGKAIVIIGGTLTAAGFALTVIAPTSTIALAGFVLVGLGASNIVPVLFSAAGAQTRMPVGLAIAAVTTMGYAGMLAGPAIMGGVAEIISLPASFAVLAAMLAIVAVVGPKVVKG